MNGIDISNWQRGIDVSATDAEFVICKATEGVGYTDPMKDAFARDVLGCGKLLGFYHFARTNGAKAEADCFLAAVEPYIGKCVLALDYEADAVDNGAGWAEEWLDYVKERTGITPIIYMSKSVCRSDDWRSVASKYGLWAAQYPSYDQTGWLDEPWTDAYGFGAWEWPLIYQYRSTGRIQGYSGNLDINKAYITAEEWRELAGSEEITMAALEEWGKTPMIEGRRIMNGTTNTSPLNMWYWAETNGEDTLKRVKQIEKDVAEIKAAIAKLAK